MVRTLAALALVSISGAALAQSGEWFVVRTPEATCDVADTVLPAYGKLAGPYATQAEAQAEMGRLAACERANTDPDPSDEDEDGGGRGR